jgi:hypothetical protein
MMTDAGSTAVVCGLLAGAIAYAWHITRSTSQDPKTLLLNTLMRQVACWHPHGSMG